jgi:hypothetical protein
MHVLLYELLLAFLVDILFKLLDTLEKLTEIALTESSTARSLWLGLAFWSTIATNALDDLDEDGGTIACMMGEWLQYRTVLCT